PSAPSPVSPCCSAPVCAVEAADQPDYVIIEANERAGLANHEPQPTAERFVDLLFPLSREVPS
ncbi:hypothetical protein ACLBVR_27980, partial [Pseudomonas aeruginosa]|uniref:hypothetical protein n=1 Tax=Pseudomonas aeruginosa TaxID=287 RepID=UPI003969171F